MNKSVDSYSNESPLVVSASSNADHVKISVDDMRVYGGDIYESLINRFMSIDPRITREVAETLIQQPSYRQIISEYQRLPSPRDGYDWFYRESKPTLGVRGGWIQKQVDVPPDSSGNPGAHHGKDQKQADPSVDDIPVTKDPPTITPGEEGGLGTLLATLGYKYLGPDTNYSALRAAGVEPVDDLDRAAMYHDQEYMDIKKDYLSGRISYDQAVEHVHYADNAFVRSAILAGDPYGLLAAYGMTAKVLAEKALQQQWFSGLDPEVERSRGNTPVVPLPPPTNPGAGVGPPQVHEVGGLIDLNNNGVDDREELQVVKQRKRKRTFRRHSSLWRL